jgi:hypothetical protein
MEEILLTDQPLSFWVMQQINQMIADVDKDGSGSIDYED